MDGFRQCRHVAKAEIETEAREGMQHMGGVAHECQPGCDETIGHIHGERIAMAPADQPDFAQMAAEALPQFVQEVRVVHGEDAGGFWRVLGPDKGRPVAGQGQDGEGTRRCEMFLGPAMVGQVMFHGDHDASLAVGPADELDPGGVAGRRVAAVGGDDQVCLDPGSVGKREFRQARPEIIGGDGTPDAQTDVGRGENLIEHGAIEVAVLDHVSLGLAAHVLLIERQKNRPRLSRRAAVGDDDLVHRLGFGGNTAPHTERLEHAPGRYGDGRGPAVEGTGRKRARVAGVDQHDIEGPPCRASPKRQGSGQTVQRGTNDDHIWIFCHGVS